MWEGVERAWRVCVYAHVESGRCLSMGVQGAYVGALGVGSVRNASWLPRALFPCCDTGVPCCFLLVS